MRHVVVLDIGKLRPLDIASGRLGAEYTKVLGLTYQNIEKSGPRYQ